MSTIHVPFEDCVDKNSFFAKVNAIREFLLVVKTPKIPRFSQREFLVEVAERAYDEALKTVQAAKFFGEEALEVKIQDSEAGEIRISYTDDKFEFDIVCSSGQIQIKRNGSSVRLFYEWYMRVMPHVNQLISGLLELMGKETDRAIEPLSVSYMFQFITYGFQETVGREVRPVRNFEIIDTLVSNIPGPDGRIVAGNSPDKVLLSRMDYRVHKWDGAGSKRRSLLFSLEAPANKDFTSLWFAFGFSGTTYSDPVTGERESADNLSIISEYERAFFTLRDIAINGFLGSIYRNRSFSSTSGNIP